ncbi:MAG: Ig-like domain-containing protein [candidate division Zixibacteria bacterium]|nr:Ig-like domain-containing protein [candidate division Zixibacteria bacterium]
MASGEIRRRLCLAGLAGIVLVLGCAKSIAPPGGPADRTPPKVTGSIPLSGTTHISLDSRLSIQFSEPIEPRNPEQAVFISPETDPPPKLAVKGDRLEIRFPGGLQPEKTYVVTMGSDLKDAHAVNLAQSVSLAFSTGAIIDSGSISGIVYKEGKATAGISLALFEKALDGVTPVDSLIPDYLTQSGKDGAFSFAYLPLKRYYLVAFDDKRKNRRINPSQEIIGIPAKNTTLDSTCLTLENINIQMIQRDTGLVSLKSVAFNADRLIKTRFGRKLSKQEVGTLLGSIAIQTTEGESQTLQVTAFTPVTPYPAADYLLLTDQPAPGKSYRVQFDQKVLEPTVVDSLRYLTGDFTVTETPDASAPILVESFPADKAANVPADSLFSFRFSEPIDSVGLDRAIRATDTIGDTFSVGLTGIDSFTWAGRPDKPLAHGSRYTLLMFGPLIRDRTGNRLSDSTIAVTFTTLDPAAWGQVSGDIKFASIPDTTAPVVLTFVAAGQGTGREVTVGPGVRHYLADLLPGYYTVNAYVDIDADGVYNPGSIIPFRPAEPFVTRPDTIRVRSRFESSGMIVEF